MIDGRFEVIAASNLTQSGRDRLKNVPSTQVAITREGRFAVKHTLESPEEYFLSTF